MSKYIHHLAVGDKLAIKGPIPKFQFKSPSSPFSPPSASLCSHQTASQPVRRGQHDCRRQRHVSTMSRNLQLSANIRLSARPCTRSSTLLSRIHPTRPASPYSLPTCLRRISSSRRSSTRSRRNTPRPSTSSTPSTKQRPTGKVSLSYLWVHPTVTFTDILSTS